MIFQKKQSSNYPFDFRPTFHRYRLDDPSKIKQNQTPSTIFVGSMCDLFGDWVPDTWIEEVFRACEKAPQHRYLFLTKNPQRYFALYSQGIIQPKYDNLWFGTTALCDDALWFTSDWNNTFLSIEPLQEEFNCEGIKLSVDWVIIGAETGNRKGKIKPKREWIEDIVEACDTKKISVFMKDSLVPIVGEENMRREFPWGHNRQSTKL